MKVQIGKVLSKLLKDQHISLNKLSKLSGVAVSTLSEWQGNRSPRKPEQVLKVATALGVSLHYLLFGEEDQEEPLQKILKEEVFQGTFEITVKKIKNNF